MDQRIKLIRGDITRVRADAIVNAANTSLLGGGGVDGAIHRAAGPELLEECRSLGGCPAGEARITKGYRLPAGYVIHTPGPVWHGGMHHEANLLASSYIQCLTIAAQKNMKSIAFPNISTGVYGYPKAEAATLAIDTVVSFLKNNKYPETVIFVCYDNENFELYSRLLPAYLS